MERKNTMKTITEVYEKDHDRLDEIFKEFQRCKRTDFTAAREYFAAFMSGLQRHIHWEEEILFPLFERKTGMLDAGPTYVMKQEHKRIKESLEMIHRKIINSNPESDHEEQMLLSALTLHNQKEESILYPAIDRFTSMEEREAVFEEMERVPENRGEAMHAGK